jgi:hypothetical protein
LESNFFLIFKNFKRKYNNFYIYYLVTTNGFEDVVIDNVKYTLLLVNMELNNNMNCDLFNSCKKTKYATQVQSMGNAVGFISFQVIKFK